jgi:hypothetical protein
MVSSSQASRGRAATFSHSSSDNNLARDVTRLSTMTTVTHPQAFGQLTLEVNER